MPPNLDSPSATLDNSSNAPIRLDQLEQTLRRLQRDTLKIKKRNETVLDTLRRDKKSKGTLGLLGQGQENQNSDNESSASGEPSKPPRTAKFLPEVSEILRQSEEMKKLMQEERRKNEEHLGRMRAEGDILSDSLKKFKLSGSTETPNGATSLSTSDGLKQYKATFNLLNGVKSSFNKAMDRLNGKNESGSGGAVLLTHREETGSPRDCKQSHHRELPEEEGLMTDFTEGMVLVKTSTPKRKERMPKPERRVKVPEGNPNGTKKAGRPRAPPPPVPVERMTIETLKELYKNASEDDATLSLRKPPVPKPRPDKQKTSTGEAEEMTKAEESAVNSGLDESSSEFDFVVAPLKVETVEVITDDSYESPKKSKGFIKNPQLKPKKVKETGSSVSTGSKLQIKATPSKSEKSQKKLPAFPPAVIVEAVDSQDTPCPRISTTPIATSPFETLEVPYTLVLETPPPPSETEDDLENHLKEKCIVVEPEEIPVVSYPSLKSSLIPGRRIGPVDIELQPWKSNGKMYDIYVAPKTFAVYTLTKRVFPEEHQPTLDFVENNFNHDDKTDAFNTISRSFSFLEDAEIIEDQVNSEEQVEVTDFPEELDELSVSPPSNEDLQRVNLEEIARILVDKEEEAEQTVITEISKSTSYFEAETVETEANYEETAIDDFQVEDTVIPDEVKVESPPPPLPSSRPPFLEEFNKPIILEIIPLQLPTETEQELLIKPAEQKEEPSGGCGPPPPPVMPEIPLFCSSSVGKTHKILPVTPLDHTYLGDSIFFTLRLDVEGDNEQLQTELRMIEGQFNKSAAEVDNLADVKLAEAPISPVQSSSVSLLSQKRRNAVAICAKRLNHLSAARIMSGLKELNTKVFTADDLQILTQIMPKDDEKSIFESVDGSKPDSLCKEDHFLKQLSEIPRCSQKLDVMNFILGFEETIQTLETDIGTLESATDSVKQSTKFPKILEVILIIINKAFVKNDDERVKAFEIHSLTKLGSKKSTDGKGSLLNFIVKCVETNFPDALNFYQDFKHVEEAARISKDECVALLKETEKGLQSVRDEIDMVQMNGENLDYSDGVSDVISFVIQATKTVDRIIRRWESAIKQLKQLMAYLALSSSEECNIKEFFGLISKFISDFKQAVSQNKRIFPTAIKTPSNTTDSSLVIRRSNRLSLGPNEFATASRSSESSVAARRQSLGNFTSNTSALQQMKEETGQPSEFIDALIVFGQKSSNDLSNESEQCKIRRRASLYTPYPYRKRYHETTSDNRERQ